MTKSKAQVEQLGHAILAQRFRLKVIRIYTKVLKRIFECFAAFMRDPSYMFDLGIVTYWISKLIV